MEKELWPPLDGRIGPVRQNPHQTTITCTRQRAARAGSANRACVVGLPAAGLKRAANQRRDIKCDSQSASTISKAFEINAGERVRVRREGG